MGGGGGGSVPIGGTGPVVVGPTDGSTIGQGGGVQPVDVQPTGPDISNGAPPPQGPIDTGDVGVAETEEERKKREAAEAAAKAEEDARTAELDKIKSETAALLGLKAGKDLRARQRGQSADAKAISVLSTILTGPLGLNEKSAGSAKTLLGQ